MKTQKSKTGSSGIAVGPTVLGVLIGVGVAALIDTTLPVAILTGALVAGLATLILLAAWPSDRRKRNGGDGGGGAYGGWDSGGDGGGGDGGGGGGGD
ncbi:MAG TPA: hypothetical protein VEA44_18105 [Caulobacter sp.]|nr:hypothetical protein [Caulobacter sp.]